MSSSKIILHFVLAITVLGMILPGCRSTSDAEKSGLKLYFSLADYFESEKANLSAVQQIEKVIRLNGKEETHVVDSLDWEAELRPFIQSDINKRSWLNKFEVDTLIEAGTNNRRISYQSADPKIGVKQMEVAFEGDQIVEIRVEKSNKTMIAQFDQTLSYWPGKGITVQHKQNSWLSSPQDLLVEMNWK